jgi:hypothetical protein
MWGQSLIAALTANRLDRRIFSDWHRVLTEASRLNDKASAAPNPAARPLTGRASPDRPLLSPRPMVLRLPADAGHHAPG